MIEIVDFESEESLEVDTESDHESWIIFSLKFIEYHDDISDLKISYLEILNN